MADFDSLVDDKDKASKAPLKAFHMGPEGITELDPEKHGTGADSRKFMRAGKPQTPVSHAYLEGSTPEEVVTAKGHKRHELEVDPTKLYDIFKDAEKHLPKAQQDIANGSYKGNPVDAVDLAKTRIKEKGYHGILRPDVFGKGSVELFYKHPLKKTTENEHGIGPASAKDFHTALQAAVPAQPNIAENVTMHSPEDLAAMKTHLSADKKSGYAITPQGELTSVFSSERGRGNDLVKHAIEQGATHLNAFEGPLTKLYGRHGFEEHKREANWEPNGPAVVHMKLQPKKKMAEGGAVGDFDSMQADATPIPKPGTVAPTQSFDSLQDDNEKYGTTGQQIGAGLEGVAQGVAGPLAPLAEHFIAGVPNEAMLGREKANPITHGVGEAAGLVGGTLMGEGVGALAGKAGEAAEAASGLGNATYAHKVGSSIVKNAAEMAALQGNDELNKTIMQDPDTSAQSAIANVGLASAIGGAAGGLFTGAVSPLWEATAGPKLDALLTGLKSHLNGESKVVLPDAVQKAVNDLGVALDPTMHAALSGDEKATTAAQELYRAQNPEFLRKMNDLPEQIRNKVADSLGVSLDDVAHFSNAEDGNAVREQAIKKIDERMGPIAERLDKRDAEQSIISIPDEERINFANKMVEHATDPKIAGTNSDYYKLYQHYAQKVLGEDTIGGLTRLQTELRGKGTLDTNERQAYKTISDMISDFKQNTVMKQAEQAGAKGLGKEALNEYAETGRQYAEHAKDMNALMDNLGIGNFKGTGTLKNKLESLTPEQIIQKFSTKGDIGSAEYLKSQFPEVAELVREHEAKKLLAPHIKTEAGSTVLDTKGLSKKLEKLMQGQPEHAAFVLPPKAIDNIQSAKVLQDQLSQIKSIKDSGTPAGIGKVFKHFGGSALGAVGWLTGHNPITSALMGELAQRVGKEGPEMYRLGLLKFLGSDKPVNASGFKSMVDFMHSIAKGENVIAKATSAVAKPGAQVLALNQIPDQKERDKLDKQVTKFTDDPGAFTKGQADSPLGHYMPEHQVAMSQAATQQLQYLQNLQPKTLQTGPLDRGVEPSAASVARYQRALNVAQQPAIVLQHIKDGTLQATDIQDLQAMYPQVYAKMVTNLTREITNAKDNETIIPYRTKMALSLFIGQPLDSSMSPSSIMAAQPQPKAPPQQGPAPKAGGKSTKSLEKGPKSYQTPTQQAESDRASRD